MIKRAPLKTGVLALALAAAVAGGPWISSPAGAANDPIAAREKVFKSFKAVMEATKGILESGQPVAAVIPEAQKVSSGAEALKTLFPAGSGKGDTEARPEIWLTPDDFAVKLEAMNTAALTLAAAAASGDATATGAAFKGLGGTCKSCHDSYRKKK